MIKLSKLLITTKNKRKKLKILNKMGFSLIELTVAIAIVAILTRVFIVTYPEYLARTQITSTIHALQAYRKQIEAFYVENNTINNNGFDNLNNISQLEDTTNGNQDLPPIDPSDGLAIISLTNNTTANANPNITLTARFNNTAISEIQNRSINLNISVNNEGIFSILCNSTDIDNALLPQECRS